MAKTTKVWLKSKLGRPFWRFGVQLSPDDWTEFDLDDVQLRELEPQLLPVSKGGALEMRRDAPAAPKPEKPETKAPEAKGGDKK